MALTCLLLCVHDIVTVLVHTYLVNFFWFQLGWESPFWLPACFHANKWCVYLLVIIFVIIY